ncbi:hypothetical protein N0B44_22885 [Roseibacterium beibuensis]|uniref:Uncharacterized protein n=1 Tax=[Roseibacterium] beibuensis TaxID=1193142 RepID=A0ABP9LIU4_9RHOB|nr:hypothetical protein [Roseibacterium beibuensis]MCS6625763.1 hypothetical protein [Roseibacterium beibuensis]
MTFNKLFFIGIGLGLSLGVSVSAVRADTHFHPQTSVTPAHAPLR